MQLVSGPRNAWGVVAIGASAGGVEAMTNLAAGLTAELPYAYLMVLHIPPSTQSALAHIIDRAGPLPATAAHDGGPLRAGHIYVGVPDRHLLVEDHHQVLSQGPTESGHRPAINALFRSVALTYGPQVIGVLMSGVLDDGVAGLAAIRSRGGITIAQSPSDALFPAMPSKAIDYGVVDHQAAAADIGELLAKLSMQEVEKHDMKADPKMELENRIAMARRFSTNFDTQELGPVSSYTCPDCNGALISVDNDNFRCHVGHAWTAEGLLSAHDREVETALWVAVRSLQEKARLSRQLAQKVGRGIMFDRYTAQAQEAESALEVLSERLGNESAAAKGAGG
jgi:two-component system, chemotaxis family, protein-glutamate methylesterase/glutaminase